jgi:hypothetical protein
MVAPVASLASGEPDPVFDLIASHKKIMGTVGGIATEIRRAVENDEKVALEQGVFKRAKRS